MNFQYIPTLTPLRVMIVNPLVPASQLIVSKILAGIVFGKHQLIDLILLVYLNEIPTAKQLAQVLISCALPCYNTIRVTSDLPSITDADVFCFITNFTNPNSLDFDHISDEQFDSLYLIIKIATSLGKPMPVEEPETGVKKKMTKVEKESRKPIIVGDGLLVIDILMSLTKNLPPEIFFFNAPVVSIARSVLSDYIKVQCSELNHVFAWGVNDEVFHLEVETPYLICDKENKESKNDWDAVGKKRLESLNLDHIQFNSSWMKREFIEKVKLFASKNPYGGIYRSAEMCKTIRAIWKSRCSTDANLKYYANVGVISDGSLETIKGLPYVLPVIFSGSTWTVNKRFEETSHLRNEIKRMNKIAKAHRQKLIPYCNKILEENVIKQAFMQFDSEGSIYSVLDQSTRSSSST